MSIYDSLGVYEVVGINKIIDRAEIELTLKFLYELSGYEMEYYEVKNYIINGNMEIAQRGVSFPAASGIYTLDRWNWLQNLGTGVVTITQDTDVPDLLSKHSFKIDCTTAEAAIAAGEYAAINYAIEGYDYFPIHSKQVTLSFWVKVTKTGVYCVSFRNSALDRSYIAEYTVNTTLTWEKKTITLTLDSSGTWLFTNGVGLYIAWFLIAGSNGNTTANAWTAGNYWSTSNQVNGLDSTDNNFWITQIQLNEGSEALPFQSELHGVTLAKCQRYYEHTYDYGIYPGAITANGSHADIPTRNTANFCSDHPFKVEKRTTPVIHLYAPASGTIDHITNSGDRDALPRNYNTKGIAYIELTAADGNAATDAYWHETIDAEF